MSLSTTDNRTVPAHNAAADAHINNGVLVLGTAEAECDIVLGPTTAAWNPDYDSPDNNRMLFDKRRCSRGSGRWNANFIVPRRRQGYSSVDGYDVNCIDYANEGDHRGGGSKGSHGHGYHMALHGLFNTAGGQNSAVGGSGSSSFGSFNVAGMSCFPWHTFVDGVEDVSFGTLKVRGVNLTTGAYALTGGMHYEPTVVGDTSPTFVTAWKTITGMTVASLEDPSVEDTSCFYAHIYDDEGTWKLKLTKDEAGATILATGTIAGDGAVALTDGAGSIDTIGGSITFANYASIAARTIQVFPTFGSRLSIYGEASGQTSAQLLAFVQNATWDGTDTIITWCMKDQVTDANLMRPWNDYAPSFGWIGIPEDQKAGATCIGDYCKAGAAYTAAIGRMAVASNRYTVALGGGVYFSAAAYSGSIYAAGDPLAYQYVANEHVHFLGGLTTSGARTRLTLGGPVGTQQVVLPLHYSGNYSLTIRGRRKDYAQSTLSNVEAGFFEAKGLVMTGNHLSKVQFKPSGGAWTAAGTEVELTALDAKHASIRAWLTFSGGEMFLYVSAGMLGEPSVVSDGNSTLLPAGLMTLYGITTASLTDGKFYARIVNDGGWKVKFYKDSAGATQIAESAVITGDGTVAVTDSAGTSDTVTGTITIQNFATIAEDLYIQIVPTYGTFGWDAVVEIDASRMPVEL